MADLRQVPLEKLIKLSVHKIGDRGDAVAAQRRNFPHVQGRLVDAQADIVGVELRETVVPPLAAWTFLVDDGTDEQFGLWSSRPVCCRATRAILIRNACSWS